MTVGTPKKFGKNQGVVISDGDKAPQVKLDSWKKTLIQITFGGRTLRARHWISLFFVVPLALLVALRGNTADTENYVEAFSQSISFPWNPLNYYFEFGKEWFFGVASWFVGLVGFTSTALFFAFSFGTFYFLSLASMKMGISLIQILPYYLGTFFLTQQLVQIRQGLAMSIAFSMLPVIVERRRSLLPLLFLTITPLVHVPSSITVFFTWLLSLSTPHRPMRNIAWWSLLLVVLTIFVARIVTSLDIISSLGPLSIYAIDSQYNTERDFFALANIRGILLLIVMLVGARGVLLQSRIFLVLISLYSVHVGLRLGFYDFLILSGRLSTTLSFSEVFILPILLNQYIRNRILKFVIGIAYLLMHAYFTYIIQIPTLIDDYFTPL